MFSYQKFSFLLMLMGLFSCACVSDILMPSTKEHLIVKIVSDFASKFIQNRTTFMTMMSASSTPEHDRMHKEIIGNFIKHNNDKFTYLYTNYKMVRLLGRHTFHLFLIETYRDFVSVLSNLSHKSLRAKPRTLYLVVITRFNHDDDVFMNNLFEASYQKSILNINFLSPHPNESVWLMSTFLPFIKHCNILQQHNIAVLTEQNYSLDGPLEMIYTTKKLDDFKQCPIIVAVFHTPPFMIINSNRSDDVEHYDGIDTRILQHLAKKFNFKLIYRTPRDKQGRGTIYDNGTVTGCIKMVTDREANVTTGAYMTTKSRNRYMMASDSYMQVALGFAVLPSEDISTPLAKLLAPFKKYVWQCTGLGVLLAVICISITKALNRRWRHFIIGGYLNSTPILNMWTVFLGGSIGNPKFPIARYLSTFARTLLMIWSLSCLVLRGSYQGALYNFMQREIFSSPLDTITKINESDCALIVMKTATSSLDIFHFAQSRFLAYNYSQQKVFQQVYDRELSGAVYCNNLQMKYFNLISYPRRLQLTKDRLFLMSVVVYFTKMSILQPLFDDELMALSASGLIQYWTTEFIDDRSENNGHTQQTPKTLRIPNVLAIFEICSGLLVFCCFVFILEKLGVRFKCLRNVIDNITY